MHQISCSKEYCSRCDSNVYSFAADLTLCHPLTGILSYFLKRAYMLKEGGLPSGLVKFLWRSFVGADCPLGHFWWYVIFLLLSNLELKNDSHRLLRKWLHVAPSKAALEFKTNACHSHHWSHYHQERVLGLGCWNGGLALICDRGAGFERRNFMLPRR